MFPTDQRALHSAWGWKSMKIQQAVPVARAPTVTIAAAVLAIGGATAWSQDSAGGLEEIVVTARKQAESLYEIPVAVSVLSQEQIVAAGITGLAELSTRVPGFFFSDQVITGRNDRSFQTGLVIRGMVPNANLSTRQTAQVFLDGAPMPGGAVRGLSDIERVEVIKGPQSAYFGRATFSGAVNLVTRDPGSTWVRHVKIGAGRFEAREAEASIEGPLVDDRLAFRFSAQYDDSDGQYTNQADTSERLGARRTEAATLTLYATPFEGFSAKLFTKYFRDEDGPQANGLFDVRDFNCDAGAGRGRNNWYCGTLPAFPASRVGTNTVVDASFRNNFIDNALGAGAIFDDSFIDDAGLKRRAFQSSLVLSYELANGASLQSISAYHDDRRQAIADSDLRDTSSIANPFFGVVPGVRPFVNWLSLVSLEDEDFSQELRFTSTPDSAWRWTLGGNYSKQDSIGSFPVESPLGPLLGLSINDRGAETTAAFAAVYRDLTERVTASLEARYQWDRIRDENLQSGLVLDETFTSFTPRVILDFQATPRALWYLSWARGVRPGAFNGNIATLPPAVQAQIAQQTGAGIAVPEEQLDMLEAGLKSSGYLDNRLQFTLAAYAGEWTDQHVSTSVRITDPATGLPRFELVTAAVGETRLLGVEFEGAFQWTPMLRLEGGFALNDSSIREYFCAVCQASLTGSADVRGNELPRTPRLSGNAAIALEHALFGEWRWFARTDYLYSAGKYLTEANLAKTAALNRINLRLGAKTESWRVEGFVDNVLDDDAYYIAERTLDLANLNFANAISVALPERRAWGVSISYDF